MKSGEGVFITAGDHVGREGRGAGGGGEVVCT